MKFHDVTITLAGDRYSQRVYDSTALVRAAVDVFADMLDQGGRGFQLPIDVDGFRHIELRFTEETPGSALASFYARGQLATTTALVSGRNTAEDRRVLTAMQQIVTRVLRAGAVEPGCDLLGLAVRPLAATIPMPNPAVPREDAMVIADMQTCVAAAYFERCKE